MSQTRRNKRKGGAATVFPLKYFDPSATEPSADAGRDLLRAIPPLGVRPKIGGSRLKRRLHAKRTKRITRTKRTIGGFVPSIMDGFVAAASKYIVPVVLFAGYKLMTRKQRHSKK